MNASIRTTRRFPRPARLLVLTALAAALAACSTVPERNAALDAARSRYSVAQSDPQVGALAPEELKRAAESLRAADEAQTAGRDRATVDHLAYMSSQRVTIAQDTAAAKSAQAVTAGAAAERDRLLLAARTQEVATAQQAANASQRDLAASRQSNAQMTTELAQADAYAQRERDRLARRDARVADLETQLSALNARKTERGMVVTLGDVLFDSGKSQLLSPSSQNMSQLAEFFRRNPERKASIEGYTDSVGSAESNLALSDRRAEAVKSALVRMGVPADRLSTQGHGEDSPVASNDTPAGRQMNRRVEIVIAPALNEVSMR
jgi:outer membrane protein OmpA-like peptidoglycan-associated protein